MRRCVEIPLLLLALAGGLGQLGCSKQEEPAAPTKGASEAMSAEAKAVEAELAKLPETERAVVAAQKVCPVTEELLGSMGPPLKVSVDGKDLYICCEGCREKAEAEFDSYFAEYGQISEPTATN